MGNLCKKEELESAGIKMNLDPSSSYHVTSILYPNFESSCNNIFRQMLTKEVFLATKNKKTPTHHISLRPILQAGLENQKHKLGCFAPDAEAYVTFDGLFNPILERLYTGLPNLKNFLYKKDFNNLSIESR